jgi:hypothetical protein
MHTKSLTLVPVAGFVFVAALVLTARSSSAPLAGPVPAASTDSTDPILISTLRPESSLVPPKLEGCISCHGLIEPMHKYGTTETLDKLKDGKDAVGLSCTACHGGNPVPRKTSEDPKEVERVKAQAHVRAMFPREWRRAGKYSGANPERTNTLLIRESWEFVRFINPGDLRVAAKTCSSQHDDSRSDALGCRAL